MTTGYSSLILEWAPATVPLGITPTWVDISAYVTDIQTDSAARGEHQTRYSAGTATFVLDNFDGRFDPNNASGPYFGNLIPRKQVRLRANDSGSVSRNVWQGIIAPPGFVIGYQLPRGSTATIQCSDWSLSVAGVDLPDLTRGESGCVVLLDSFYPPAVLADTPAAYYRLNDTSGTTAVDSSGNAHDGTYNDACVLGVRGWISVPDNLGVPIANNAVRLGTRVSRDGYISLPNATFSPSTGSLTIEAWINLPLVNIPGSNSSLIYSLQFTAPAGQVLLSYNYDTAAFTFGITPFTLTVNYAVADTGWRHIVATYSSAGGGVASFYVDGLLVSTATVGATTTTGTVNSNKIGADISATDRNYGEIADVALYTTALSAARIEAHMLVGRRFAGELSGARITRILDIAGIPGGALRNVDVGQTVLGAATWGNNALDEIQTVAETEGGAFYFTAGNVATFDDRHAVIRDTRFTAVQSTFTDTTFGIDFEDIQPSGDDVWNHARIAGISGNVQEVEDATSITNNGEQIVPLGQLEMQNDPEAYARAEWYVKTYKDPLNGPGVIQFDAAANNGTLDLALQRLLRDHIAVIFTPPGVAQQTFDCFIEGISHRIPVAASPRTWTVIMKLSSAARYAFTIYAQVLVMDDATKGKLDNARLGP